MSRQRKYYVEPRKPSGIHYYIVRDPVSRTTLTYKSTGTKDKKQAELIALDWWTNGVPGKADGNGIDRKITFCDWLYRFWDFDTSDYFRELETMGKEPHIEHTLEMQKEVDRYYRPYFQSKLLCQIDEKSLDKFLVHLKQEKKLAAGTVNSARNVAMVALRYAKKEGLIQRFDFDAVLRAGGKASIRGILEREEADRLFALEWPRPRIRPVSLSRVVALICYNTGMRLGEVQALRVCDIHEDRISVEHSWARKSKQKSTKTKESRDIPILPELHGEIMAYIREMGLFKLDSLLFPGEKPEAPYSGEQIRKDFYKMLEEIGINEKTRKERGIVLHSFRHQLCKNLAQKQTNKAIAMKIMGHRTSRMYDHYSNHTDSETFRQMAAAMKKASQSDAPKEPIPFKKVV